MLGELASFGRVSGAECGNATGKPPPFNNIIELKLAALAMTQHVHNTAPAHASPILHKLKWYREK